MKIKILDRYIINELIWPFFFGIATFTLLFMSVDLFFRIASLIVEKQITLYEGLICVIYNLPSILVYTFPMSVLLAVLLGFGRLSGDSEIIAMKSAGISFYRIALSAVLITLIITLFSYLINEYISPETTYRARNIILRKASAQGSRIRENLVIQETTPDGLERITTARKFDYSAGSMEGVMIQDYKMNTPIRWIYSKSGIWQDNTWYLLDGDIYNLSADSSGDIKYKTHFDKIEIPLPHTPQDLETRERSPEEMNSFQIKNKIKLMTKLIQKSSDANSNKDLNNEINKLNTYYYQKLSLPFTCFVFGLFGIPLGLRPHRTTKSIGLGLSIIFIFLFYILTSVGRALGGSAVLPAVLAAWLPNLIFGALGIVMIYKTGQH